MFEEFNELMEEQRKKVKRDLQIGFAIAIGGLVFLFIILTFR